MERESIAVGERELEEGRKKEENSAMIYMVITNDICPLLPDLMCAYKGKRRREKKQRLVDGLRVKWLEKGRVKPLAARARLAITYRSFVGSLKEG